MYDAAFLELGKDPAPRQTVTNILQIIVRNNITYDNVLTSRKQALLSQKQIKYVEDTSVTRDTLNLGMTRREVIQKISDIVQAYSYNQVENIMD